MQIILRNKISIENALEGMTLSDSIDGVAYKCSMKLSEAKAIQDLKIKKADTVQIIDKLYGANKDETIFNGIVWGRNKNHKTDTLDLTLKERNVYIESSEDEYVFKESTLDDRIRQIAKDWNIPIGNIPKTGIKLEKCVEKGKLQDMIRKFIKETVKKGGKMYVLRMENKLNLYEIGSNKIVYDLESIMEDATDVNSLEGAVTSVKVLGKSKNEKSKTPVIGTYKKNDKVFGTLQKIKQDDKIKNVKDAKKAAEAMFSDGEDMIKFSGVIDISTIRAGDKVKFYGVEYYVIDVTHSIEPHRKMTLNAGSKQYVKGKFFNE
ncbi:XkdQ/YqbQ family protein [Peptostreptococcus sp. D1]|uniref:XkdQ/YqbQ family protein n=1 Tax=Peptostreptococcus sp. D1 TaxID=72304 RepID=UPI0008E25EE2|nr:XkdQ [Peptostreptococcus sp. D1]SFE92180.1 hypothetical protein SAMN02910278_02073 [Peptostreptococcus sp. D1]